MKYKYFMGIKVPVHHSADELEQVAQEPVKVKSVPAPEEVTAELEVTTHSEESVDTNEESLSDSEMSDDSQEEPVVSIEGTDPSTDLSEKKPANKSKTKSKKSKKS